MVASSLFSIPQHSMAEDAAFFLAQLLTSDVTISLAPQGADESLRRGGK
jgi:hypothetical protein